jgi:hypothetical protein
VDQLTALADSIHRTILLRDDFFRGIAAFV